MACRHLMLTSLTSGRILLAPVCRLSRVHPFSALRRSLTAVPLLLPGERRATSTLPVIGTPWKSASTCRMKRSVIPSATSAGNQVDFKYEVNFFPKKYPKVTTISKETISSAYDLFVVGVFQDAFEQKKDGEEADDAPPALGATLAAVDREKFGGMLEALTSTGGFDGSKGTSTSGVWLQGLSKVLALVGFGKKEDATGADNWGASAFQSAGGAIASLAKATKAKTVLLEMATDDSIPEAALGKIAQGVLLGAYEATRFKANAKESPLEELVIYHPEANAADTIAHYTSLAKGTLLARYLVEAPPNICTPTHLAEAAEAVRGTASDVLSLEVLEEEQCAQLGMGLYLGVAECSAEPSKFIHLTYKPPGGSNKKVALVGKGLTFDSGGYNLKVHGMIEMMKFDMGGAAAVLGAALAVGAIKPPGVEIHFITASCENMIDGKGMRPGDILTAANGKTVEVNNTDAEGRLTLGDALWYAQEHVGATAILDIATLTGACMIALGTQVAGVFTPSDTVAQNLQLASEKAGEKVWRMPMDDAYWEAMKSPIADMKNSGGRYGGAITAALFLKQYVDTKKVDWAHIDIAGPAWDEKSSVATGFGAATLAEWAIAQGHAAPKE